MYTHQLNPYSLISSISLSILFSLFTIGCSNNSENSGKDSDLGKMKEINSPAGSQSAEPYLFTSTEGEVFCLWTERKEDKVNELRFSRLLDGKWEKSKLVARGDNWFVNWADFPAMAVSSQGNMVAHYLAKSGESTYAYDVNIIHSADSGKNWSDAQVLHDDNTQTEHGFVSMFGTTNGRFFLTWLDGRNTAQNQINSHENHNHTAGAMSIRAAYLDSNGQKIEEHELDNRVCDCCQTGTVLTDNGPIVVYRNRSEDEIRDICIVRYEGGKWSSPQVIYPDNWKIAGCPVNGPRVDASGNHLAIAWFSAANDTPQVKIIFSKDGGKSFGKAIRIDHGQPLGRVDIEMLDAETALVSWLESENKTGRIMASIVNKEGKTLQTFTISETSQARASGFPQMTNSKEGIIFAWTQVDSVDDRSIRTALLSYDQFEN
ncbi:MAG: exo-alpha-sialidase [Bacteroidia bacterium]